MNAERVQKNSTEPEMAHRTKVVTAEAVSFPSLDFASSLWMLSEFSFQQSNSHDFIFQPWQTLFGVLCGFHDL